MLRDGHVHHVVDVFQGRKLHDLRDLLDNRDVALFLHRHLHDLVHVLDLRDILGKNCGKVGSKYDQMVRCLYLVTV